METIQNYALDDSGQPSTDPDTNLISAPTYHVTQQIASTGTLSPNDESVAVSGNSFDIILGIVNVGGVPAVQTPPGMAFIMYYVAPGDSSGTLVPARYDNAGWTTFNGADWVSITTTASDVLVATVGFSYDDAAVTDLQGQSGFFEGVQEGYRSGTFSKTVSSSVNLSGTQETYSFDLSFADNTFEPYYLAQTSLDIYGTGVGDSSPAVWRNDLLRAVIYADSSATWGNVVDGTASNLVEYTYDRQSETASMTDQNGTTHAYAYDGIGHELTDSITVPSGNPANIDLTVTELAFAYKVCGRFLSATSIGPIGEVVNQVLDHYDANGDLDKIYQEHGGPVDTSTSEYVAYGYDETTSSVDDPALGGYVTVADTAFRPTTLQYPTTGTSDSRVITDSYGTSGGMNDEINQLDSIIDGTGTASSPTTGGTIDTVAHPGDGTITAETYNQPNIGYNLLGTTGTSPNIDQFNRVQNMVWANYGAETTLDGFEYLRNTQGDVTQRINAVDAVFSEMYVNDKLDQVESLTRGTISDGAIASPTFTEDFSPNGFGNLSSVTTDGVEQDQNFTSTNELLNYNDSSGSSTSDWVAPTYDAAGNSTVTPDPLDPTTGLNILVDGWNHVTQVSYSDSIGVSYSYDALGNMIMRVNTLTASDKVSTTDIYYSGQQVVEEDPRLPASPDGTATAVAHQYVYSPRGINTPILDTQTAYTVMSEAWTSATSTYYFLTDANNNVTSLVNSSGGAVERYIYSAFGNVTMYDGAATPGGSGIDYSNLHTVSSFNNTILYACMTIDTETGIYNDSARFYSALTSTFLTTDPAQSDFDTYRYVGNDPIDGTDPTGLNEVLYGGGGTSWDLPLNPCGGSNAPAEGGALAGVPFLAPPRGPELFISGGGSGHPAFSTGSNGSFSSAYGSNPTYVASGYGPEPPSWWSENRISQRIVGGMKVAAGYGTMMAGGVVVAGSGILEVGSFGLLTPAMVVTAGAGAGVMFVGVDYMGAGTKEVMTGLPQKTITETELQHLVPGWGEGQASAFQDGVILGTNIYNMTAKKPCLPAPRGAPGAGSGYGHLVDPPGVGVGEDFTAAQKAAIIAANRARNGGVVRSDLSGRILEQPAKSMKGVSPSPDEWQIDHIIPKDGGGSNSYSNAQVLSRAENRAKWNN